MPIDSFAGLLFTFTGIESALSIVFTHLHRRINVSCCRLHRDDLGQSSFYDINICIIMPRAGCRSSRELPDPSQSFGMWQLKNKENKKNDGEPRHYSSLEIAIGSSGWSSEDKASRWSSAKAIRREEHRPTSGLVRWPARPVECRKSRLRWLSSTSINAVYYLVLLRSIQAVRCFRSLTFSTWCRRSIKISR